MLLGFYRRSLWYSLRHWLLQYLPVDRMGSNAPVQCRHVLTSVFRWRAKEWSLVIRGAWRYSVATAQHLAADSSRRDENRCSSTSWIASVLRSWLRILFAFCCVHPATRASSRSPRTNCSPFSPTIWQSCIVRTSRVPAVWDHAVSRRCGRHCVRFQTAANSRKHVLSGVLDPRLRAAACHARTTSARSSTGVAVGSQYLASSWARPVRLWFRWPWQLGSVAKIRCQNTSLLTCPNLHQSGCSSVLDTTCALPPFA